MKNTRTFQKSGIKIKSNYDVKSNLFVKKDDEILNFLLNNLQGYSRNNIKALLKNHQIIINGTPVKQFDYKILVGDSIDILKNRHFEPAKNPLEIVYEDDEIVVINKREGLLTIASDKEKTKTALQEVTAYLRLKNIKARAYICHRLDKGTSGILMFAKNMKLQKKLQDNWNDLVLARGYFAVVMGKMEKETDNLEMYLAENNFNLMYVTKNTKEGKLSLLKYKVLKTSDKYSYLDVHIDSGRKNQIRVMLGHLGHFVLGDDKYGEPDDPLKRLALHSYELTLIHPDTRKKMSFKTKPPVSFTKLFKEKNEKKG